MKNSRRPLHRGGHPPCADGRGGGDVLRRHALGALAAAARGRRPSRRPSPITRATSSPRAATSRSISGVASFTVKKFLERVPAERLRPGDVWFLNLPEVGGNHLPDVKAIRPIFLEGRLFAFAVSLAHWGDIGGAWAGSYFAAATETWQEGVRIPPLAALHRRRHRRGETRLPAGQPARPGRARRATFWPRWPRRARPRAASTRLCEEHGAATIRAALDRLDDLPRRRCARRSPACPTASTRARTSSTTTGRAGEPAAIRVRVGDRGRSGELRLQRHRRCASRAAQHHAVRGDGRGLLRHQGGGRAGDPAHRRLLPRPGGAHAAGLDPRSRHRQAGGRRQPRDLAACRRRHHEGLRPGGAGAA